MKTFKKIAVIMTCAALLLCTAFALSACGTESTEGVVTIVIESSNANSGEQITTREFEVDLDDVEGDSVINVFEYIEATENVAFEMDGTMVDRVGDLKNDWTAGVYIYLYTSVEADMDVSEYKMTKEYDGKTLTSSGVGIGDMHLEDGAIIYVGTISYG